MIKENLNMNSSNSCCLFCSSNYREQEYLPDIYIFQRRIDRSKVMFQNSDSQPINHIHIYLLWNQQYHHCIYNKLKKERNMAEHIVISTVPTSLLLIYLVALLLCHNNDRLITVLIIKTVLCISYLDSRLILQHDEELQTVVMVHD